MFALVLSRRIALLLINAYKYKLACACVFPLNHVHDKKLRHNPVKSYIKYADIHWKRLLSPGSLLPSTIRLNGLLLMSLSKSFLMSYPRQFLVAAAFFLRQENFLAAVLSLNSFSMNCVIWSERLKKVLWWTISNAIFISASMNELITFRLSKVSWVKHSL